MIDIHCHVLCGIDDASQEIKASLDMLRIAESDGIKVICATSHVKYPLFPNNKEMLDQAYEELLKAKEEANINIDIIYAAENYVDHNTISLLEEDKFFPYNGGKYILIEFAWTKNMYDRYESYIRKVKEKGYIPVIAHPERYEVVHEDYNVIKRWKEMGCLMQVNRTSVFGLDKIQKANDIAKQMLEDGLVDVIASDAHRSYAPRLPKLSDVYHYISTQYGEEKAKLYLIDNPLKIIGK